MGGSIMRIRNLLLVSCAALLVGCDSNQQQPFSQRVSAQASESPGLPAEPPHPTDCVRADFVIDGLSDGTKRAVYDVPTNILPDGACQAATLIVCDGRPVQLVAEVHAAEWSWTAELYVDGKHVYATEAYDSGNGKHTAAFGPAPLGLPGGSNATYIQVTWYDGAQHP